MLNPGIVKVLLKCSFFGFFHYICTKQTNKYIMKTAQKIIEKKLSFIGELSFLHLVALAFLLSFFIIGFLSFLYGFFSEFNNNLNWF